MRHPTSSDFRHSIKQDRTFGVTGSNHPRIDNTERTLSRPRNQMRLFEVNFERNFDGCSPSTTSTVTVRAVDVQISPNSLHQIGSLILGRCHALQLAWRNALRRFRFADRLFKNPQVSQRPKLVIRSRSVIVLTVELLNTEAVDRTTTSCMTKQTSRLTGEVPCLRTLPISR